MLVYAVDPRPAAAGARILSTGSDLVFVKQVFELTLAEGWTAEGRGTFARLIEAAEVFPMFRYFRAYDEAAGRLAGVLAADNELSHVSLLFVHPDYMRKGVGSALIRALVRATPQAGLTVNAEPSAVLFYEKNGFTPCTGVFDTRDGITTLRMFRSLKTAVPRHSGRSAGNTKKGITERHKKGSPPGGTAFHADDRT